MKRVPVATVCIENMDCGGAGFKWEDNTCDSEAVPDNSCLSDYDCLATQFCNQNATLPSCKDLPTGQKCATRVHCEIGKDCIDGECKESDESLVAFPVTLYDVACDEGALNFNCSVTFTVPKQNETETSFIDKSGPDFQYLIAEVNARFSPANVDLVADLSKPYDKEIFYGIEITDGNIEIEDPITTTQPDVTTTQPTTDSSPTTTVASDKTTTTSPGGEGSGEGSGENAWL